MFIKELNNSNILDLYCSYNTDTTTEKEVLNKVLEYCDLHIVEPTTKLTLYSYSSSHTNVIIKQLRLIVKEDGTKAFVNGTF